MFTLTQWFFFPYISSVLKKKYFPVQKPEEAVSKWFCPFQVEVIPCCCDGGCLYNLVHAPHFSLTLWKLHCSSLHWLLSWQRSHSNWRNECETLLSVSPCSKVNAVLFNTFQTPCGCGLLKGRKFYSSKPTLMAAFTKWLNVNSNSIFQWKYIFENKLTLHSLRWVIILSVLSRLHLVSFQGLNNQCCILHVILSCVTLLALLLSWLQCITPMKCCLILQPQNPTCYNRLMELITAIPDLLQAQDQA